MVKEGISNGGVSWGGGSGGAAAWEVAANISSVAVHGDFEDCKVSFVV